MLSSDPSVATGDQYKATCKSVRKSARIVHRSHALLERESARRTVLLPILGMKQSIEEQVAKGLLGVLHNLVASTSLIATNFLRLLLQFVNRDLSNEHGEVFP